VKKPRFDDDVVGQAILPVRTCDEEKTGKIACPTTDVLSWPSECGGLPPPFDERADGAKAAASRRTPKADSRVLVAVRVIPPGEAPQARGAETNVVL